MSGFMLMSILNPTSTTKPHPQGKSPIRCITTVLLIGWDLSVIMKDCNDGMCNLLWSVVGFIFTVIVLTFIYSCGDVRVLDILHQAKYANKNKTNIPVRKSVNGTFKQLQQLKFVLLLSFICFCLDIFHLQSVFPPNSSRSLCVLDLSSVSCIDCFCNPQASRCAFETTWSQDRRMMNIEEEGISVSNFSFSPPFLPFLLFPLSPLCIQDSIFLLCEWGYCNSTMDTVFSGTLWRHDHTSR